MTERRPAFFDQVSLPCLEEIHVRSPGNGPKELIGGEMHSGSLDNLKFMNLWRCNSIRCIAKANTVTLLQNLQTLEAVYCSEMEFLIDFEGLNAPNALSKRGLEIFPKLESLNLQSSPRLIHIWRNFSEGARVFQNLKFLDIWDCPLLKCLFYPSCVANMLISLERVVVSGCSQMLGVIDEEDGEVSQEDNAQQHGDVGEQREITLERTRKEGGERRERIFAHCPPKPLSSRLQHVSQKRPKRQSFTPPPPPLPPFPPLVFF